MVYITSFALRNPIRYRQLVMFDQKFAKDYKFTFLSTNGDELSPFKSIITLLFEQNAKKDAQQHPVRF